MICLLFVISPASGSSQLHGGIQQYYYTGHGSASFVPKLYFETPKSWFGELRYNYEDSNTVSLNGGRKFIFTRWPVLSVSPFAGLVTGKFRGSNIGSNVNLEHKKWYVSLESQYSLSFDERSRNFFYNWSEAGYQFCKYAYGGIASQLTSCFGKKAAWEPGLLIAPTFKNWTFPVYAFNPAGKDVHYVLGLNWEWPNEKQNVHLR